METPELLIILCFFQILFTATVKLLFDYGKHYGPVHVVIVVFANIYLKGIVFSWDMDMLVDVGGNLSTDDYILALVNHHTPICSLLSSVYEDYTHA